MGLKDLFQKYPAELRSHRYAVIEKLRERIGDDDKVVRETLYQLLKTVVFPGCKEVNLCLPFFWGGGVCGLVDTFGQVLIYKSLYKTVFSILTANSVARHPMTSQCSILLFVFWLFFFVSSQVNCYMFLDYFYHLFLHLPVNFRENKKNLFLVLFFNIWSLTFGMWNMLKFSVLIVKKVFVYEAKENLSIF